MNQNDIHSMREIFYHIFSYTILFLISISSFSQSFVYFNNRYDITNTGSNDFVSSVLEIDKRYIITGTSKDYNSTNPNWFMSILSMDKHGAVASSKTIGDVHANYIFESPGGTLIKYDDSLLFAAGVKRTYTSNWVHDQGMLLCLNKQLDTIWSKLYGEKTEPYDTAYLMYQIKKTTQNDLIMTGVWKPYALPSYVWLLKTEPSGNVIWEKSFGNGYYYYHGYSVIQTSDGGYAIGAYVWEVGNNNSGDPIVIKTDSLGNQEWIKNLGGGYSDDRAIVFLSDDDNIIVGTSFAHEMVGYNAKGRINIIKINNNGDILWNKQYGRIELLTYTFRVIEAHDNNIIAIGTMVNDYPQFVGWMLKLNLEGDSLWYREYKILDGGESENRLYDIKTTLDHGFISCGMVYPRSPDTGTRDIWVLKLDSIGCPFPLCDTTVGVVEMPFNEKEELVIYPNPAKNWLQAAGFKLQANGRLMIYDIYGRKVEEIVVPEGQDQVRIDVTGYQNGIYFAILYSDSQITDRKKFMVTW